MTRRAHLRLFLVYTIAWAAFWAAGLPSYYQQYSRTFMIWLDGLVLIPLSVVFLLVLRRAPQTRRIGLSLWMAFYFTVPLAVYDWLYCGVFLGHGLGFLRRYWYLSVYYVIPWPLLPSLAAVLNRRGAPRVRTEVFVGYDQKHVYLAARLWQRRDSVRAGAIRRDGKATWDGDFVTFVLDPLLSANSAYFLAINPSGTVADGILTSSAEWNTDWDGVWSSSVSISDEYWTVEIGPGRSSAHSRMSTAPSDPTRSPGPAARRAGSAATSGLGQIQF